MSKPIFAFATLLAVTSFGLVACSASQDDSPTDDPTGEVQDQELKKSITACNVDADCTAVPRGGCCQNGWLEAVNTHHVKAYENATKCTLNPRPMCPMYMVHDTRIAVCQAKQCKMVENPTASIQGEWGADGAIMNVAAGHASIEFGCGYASIDTFSFSGANDFTGTGTHTRGSGVMPPPGMEPRPEPATFKGHISGTTLKLDMKVGSYTSTYTFTKDRQINLMRCL